ncbi:YciI family protein [Naasia sp. SYSU D00948]|uniref:YciI family protein n=1 Tax=Naasia sp. SYSU D00948 TaxID=2817379 RepID=UPI001B308918|nr:YciI family protein [Naasia sp. SYSU D00948]
MTHYLLSLYQPDGIVPPPELLEPVMQRLDEVNREIQAAGSWMFTGGLHQPDTATVVRPRDAADPLLTDGPYVESKEHVGGFWIIRAEDLDAALGWGRRVAQATGLPVEVRPFAFSSAE